MKKLIPLLDRVLIQRADAITKTAGGIVIPEKAQGKVLKGTVVAVGPGARNQVSSRYFALRQDVTQSFLLLGRPKHSDGRQSRRQRIASRIRRHKGRARRSKGVPSVQRVRHHRQSWILISRISLGLRIRTNYDCWRWKQTRPCLSAHKKCSTSAPAPPIWLETLGRLDFLL